MDGINTNGLRLKVSGEQREPSEQTFPQFQAGELIEGVITSVAERVSINFSGKEYSFPSESVRNAREGETRIYKIMEASGASFRLKEMGENETVGGQGGILFTTVTTDPLAVSDCLGSTEETGEAEEDGERLDEIANRMTEEDLSGLEEEGMTLDRFNLGRLERMLEQRKALRELMRAGIEGQKENLELKQEFATKAARKTAAAKLTGNALKEQIAKRLEEVNLPATESNVNRIAEAMNMAEEAQYMTEASFSYLIGERLAAQWAPTIENCYKAVHIRTARTTPLAEEVYRALQPQIAQVIEEAGLAGVRFDRASESGTVLTGVASSGAGNNGAGLSEVEWNSAELDKAKADARWLLEHELPLTAENLHYKRELEQLRDSFGQGILNQESLLEGTIETLYFRGEPKQTDLSRLVKREEIRLQMTEEAAGRIRDFGIEMDTASIRERIKSLREEELKACREQLQAAGLGEDAGEVLTQTLAAAETVRNAPAALLAFTFASRHLQTLRSLAQTTEALAGGSVQTGQMSGTEALAGGAVQTGQVPGTQAAWVGQVAESAYEALMTSPRSDMGDSIQKAFQNVDSQLEGLRMDTSEENRRAVRILGYNSLPLTEENITQMKYYDARVTGLIEQLQPQVTVGLIRRGINPLTESLDTVSLAAEEIARELGPTPEERFSEFLVKLDKKKELSKEERDSYIGIYRTLYQIQKTDGAAVGALVQSGRELNLKNLLTEARTRKSPGINAAVDDNFGEAESVRFREKNINVQAEAAFRTGQVSKAVQELHQLTAGEPEDVYRQEQLDELRELAQDSLEELRFLEHYEIENSINNIRAAKALLQNQNPYLQLAELAGKKRGSRITEIIGEAGYEPAISPEDAIEIMGSQESLNTYCETAAVRAGELMEQLYMEADLTAMEAADLKNIANSVELSRELLNREYYEIPIQDESGITGLRLAVVHGSGEEGNFHIIMHGAEAGTVRMDGKIREERLELLVTTDKRGIYDKVKANRKDIMERTESIGLGCETVNFALTEHVPETMLDKQYRSKETAVRTNDETDFRVRNGAAVQAESEAISRAKNRETVQAESEAVSQIRNGAAVQAESEAVSQAGNTTAFKEDMKTGTSTSQLYQAAKEMVLMIRRIIQ